MIIGIPKEIKTQEYRVSVIPAGVRDLVRAGAKVVVQAGAGLGSGIQDKEYEQAGATVLKTAPEVWQAADMIIKVKEPLPPEFSMMKENQIIYTYLHLAVVPDLAKELIKKKITAIAYETIQLPNKSLPLLKPMSEVAGKMAVQIGSSYLQKEHGGRGVLLGGVPGVRRGRVTIIGAGVVGMNACKVAVGMGANVTVIDVNVDRLEYFDDIFGTQIQTLKSHSQNIEESVMRSDLLIGAVLVPGAKAPKLVTRELVAKMAPGSVIVDVAVDQGGCVETCKPTTHDDPTFIVEGVIHYCVANMPGAVAMSSTFALTNATISYAKKMVELGVDQAIKTQPDLALGVNTYRGHVTYKAVAEALNQPHHALESLLT